MRERSKQALAVLATSILLGLAADLLLRALPWGLNLCLWTVLLATAAVLLAGPVGERQTHQLWTLLLTAAAAAAFTWRDSPALATLDFLVILGSLALTAFRSSVFQMRSAVIKDYVLALIATGLHSSFGFAPLLIGDVQWSAIERRHWSHRSAAALRGVLIAVPLLLVFGSLFVAADAAFAGIVGGLFRFDLGTMLQHGFVAGCFCWLSAGFLRGLLLARTAATGRGLSRQSLSLGLDGQATSLDDAVESGVQVTRRTLSLGIVEIGTVLGLLDLLFLAFVAVQFRYFFGGAPLVQASPTLTYADYARRGFFELVTAAALVLPLLLLADWLVQLQNSGQKRLFQALAGALVLMLYVVMVSALQRMRLYQHEYGLTESRLYTTAFMGWLGLVFAWLTVTVLAARRDRFASGAVLAAVLAVAALEILNPDALIAHANSRRIATGQTFDASHAASLSADAVPALLDALPQMDRQQRCLVARSLLSRWSPEIAPDWRTWNWSRARARALVQEHSASLRQTAC